MDSKTILTLLGIVDACIGLLFLYFVVSNKKHHGFLIAFTASKFTQAAGAILLSLRYSIPDYFSLNIGGGLIITGYALELFAVVSYDNIFRKWVLRAITIPAASAVIIFWFAPFLQNYVLVIIYDLIAGFLFAFAGVYLIIKKSKTSTVSLIAYAYLVFSMALFTGLSGAAIEREGYQLIYSGNPYELMVQMFSFIFIIIGSVGYLLILKEADEQKVAERNVRIEADNIKLQGLLTKKDKFFSIIAHDLKSPIGALIQLGYILQKTHANIPVSDREEIIEIISGSAKKTYNLLENLLLWSRAETGRSVPHPSRLNLRELMEETLELLKHNAEQKKISVANKIDDIATVFADRNMISTVFRNIVSNAIKYVHDGGNISITSATDTAAKNVVTSICDDGVGIDPKVIKKLFDLDNNYSTKGTKNESGTGLGLKLCKEFVSKNGGTIKVESAIGAGSTFQITLPLASQSVPSKSMHEPLNTQ